MHMITVLLAYVVFFACFVVRDLCRSGCRQNYSCVILIWTRWNASRDH